MVRKVVRKKSEVKPASRAVEILQKVQDSQGVESLTLLDAQKIVDVPRQSSGIFSLDIALGGGYPEGRIIELFGSEGSGKTTACLTGIASVQAHGHVAAYVDVEHAIDPAYSKKLGVNFNELLFAQSDSGEHALDVVKLIAENMIKGDMIVVDSVANLVPRAELEGEMGDQQVGLQARMMSKALRKLTALVSQQGIILIFINQLRSKIGIMYGNPETTTGGRALKYYANQRIEVKAIGKIKKREEIVGQKVRFKVVKNKVAPPFRQAEVELRYGQGFSRTLDIVRVGAALQPPVIDKSGGTHSYQGGKLGVSAEKSAMYLESAPEVLANIEKEIMERYV